MAICPREQNVCKTSLVELIFTAYIFTKNVLSEMDSVVIYSFGFLRTSGTNFVTSRYK